jgi:hypothetical protein
MATNENMNADELDAIWRLGWGDKNLRTSLHVCMAFDGHMNMVHRRA